MSVTVTSLDSFLGRRLQPNEDPAYAVQQALLASADAYEQLPAVDENLLREGKVRLVTPGDMGFATEEEIMAEIAAQHWACTRYF